MTGNLRVLASAIVLALALPLQVTAQLSTVTFGSRVRVVTPATSGDPGSVRPGLIRAVFGDTVTLETAAGPIDTIVMRPAMKLERWSGTHGNGGIGLLAGFIAGYAYGSGHKDTDSPALLKRSMELPERSSVSSLASPFKPIAGPRFRRLASASCSARTALACG